MTLVHIEGARLTAMTLMADTDLYVKHQLLRSTVLCIAALLVHGVDSVTADEIAKVLHFKIDVERVDQHVRADVACLLDGLVRTLEDRLEGLGRVRLAGKNRVEVEIQGDPTPAKLESINRRVLTQGMVEFRYLASSKFEADRSAIEQALKLSTETSLLSIGFMDVAEWASLAEDKSSADLATEYSFATRDVGGRREVLKVMDSLNLTGEYLAEAKHVAIEGRSPSLEFTFSERGSMILSDLTSRSYIAGGNGTRFLGFFMDNRLTGGMPIRKSLSKRVVISGPSNGEIEDIISILNHGILSFPLKSATPQDG